MRQKFKLKTNWLCHKLCLRSNLNITGRCFNNHISVLPTVPKVSSTLPFWLPSEKHWFSRNCKIFDNQNIFTWQWKRQSWKHCIIWNTHIVEKKKLLSFERDLKSTNSIVMTVPQCENHAFLLAELISRIFFIASEFFGFPCSECCNFHEIFFKWQYSFHSSTLHTVKITKIYSHCRNISSNHLFSNFSSKNVTFTKFLPKMNESKFGSDFVCKVWRCEK